MTTGQDRPSEQLVRVWETLPLPDQAEPDVPVEDPLGSSPNQGPSGRRWEPYSPATSAGLGESLAEPLISDAPERRRRPVAVWVGAATAVVVCLVGSVVARSSLPHARVADTAPGSNAAAPGPAVAADPHQARIGGTPLPGVVAVYGQMFSTTGLVVDEGTVAVPYHPMTNARSGRITVVAPGGDTMDATMAGFDTTRDVAVLTVPRLKAVKAPSFSTRPVREGDRVDVSGYAIGRFGAGPEYASTVATEVSDTRARISVELAWTEFFADVPGLMKVRLKAAGDGGVGQAVFASGDVTGLVIDQEGSSAYALPIADVAEIVSTVRSGLDRGTVRVGPPGSLGVTVAPNSTGGFPSVATVQPFGPAAKAGIKEGDLLITVGTVSLDPARQHRLSPAAAQRMLKPGSPVRVTWISGASGDRKTATVVPTPATGY